MQTTLPTSATTTTVSVSEVGMAVAGSASTATKYASLLCLTLQNVALIVALRYSRTREGDKYIMTTAVVVSEVVKLSICLLIILIQEGSYRGWLRHLYNNIVKLPTDCLKISVPGIIYMVQNNLLYIAVANLEATTFQVTYQLKILTTAVFSVSMLGKKLSRTQWMSLILLFVGVSIIIYVQTSQNDNKLNSAGTKLDTKTAVDSLESTQKPLLGVVAVLISCVLSGFAGVYFERLLKNTPQSLFVRNVQLGTFGAVTGLAAVVMFDGDKITEKGFFFGYDQLVVVLVLLQSLGGILVAVVVKYADNILKGFATSAAIVLSCIVSVFFFDFQPSLTFLLAAILVVVSVYIYNKGSIGPVTSHLPARRRQEVV